MALENSIERLCFNDALVSDAGHRIELIDPGFPHEPCYTVRLGETIYFMSPTARHYDSQRILAFLDTFDWKALNLPTPAGKWQRVVTGASNNPLWDRPLGVLLLQDYRLLLERSEQTGALKTQARIRRRQNHRANGNSPGKVIKFIESRCRRGAAVTTEAQFAVGRCYTPGGRGKRQTTGIVRIDAISETTLGDMTLEDLYAEGYSQWDAFYQRWRKRNGELALTTRVWCLHVAPVLTKPGEFQVSDFRPTFTLPLDQMPLQGRLVGF